MINFLSTQDGFLADTVEMVLKSYSYLFMIGSLKPRLVYIIAGGLRTILDDFEGIIEWFVRKGF